MEEKQFGYINFYIGSNNVSLNVYVSGGCCGSTKKSIIVGGWAWAWWLVTDVQYLSLEVRYC